MTATVFRNHLTRDLISFSKFPNFCLIYLILTDYLPDEATFSIFSAVAHKGLKPVFNNCSLSLLCVDDWGYVRKWRFDGKFLGFSFCLIKSTHTVWKPKETATASENLQQDRGACYAHWFDILRQGTVCLGGTIYVVPRQSSSFFMTLNFQMAFPCWLLVLVTICHWITSLCIWLSVTEVT